MRVFIWIGVAGVVVAMYLALGESPPPACLPAPDVSKADSGKPPLPKDKAPGPAYSGW